MIDQSNRRNAKLMEDERQFLQPLPKNSVTDYSEFRVVVTSLSTIKVRRVTYTVPSRLQGEVLNVRIYDDRLCCYLGAHHVITLQHLHIPSTQKCGRQVDYRHVIGSLVKKPQAFRYSQLRDDLLPNDTYRTIWTVVNEKLSALEVCKFIVGLLHLASTYNCERELGETVLHSLNRGQLLSITVLEKMFNNQQKNKHFTVQITQHPLEYYNHLIPNFVQEACHA